MLVEPLEADRQFSLSPEADCDHDDDDDEDQEEDADAGGHRVYAGWVARGAAAVSGRTRTALRPQTPGAG